ncbi:Kin of IRRE-like protein 3 [Cichlidogyrus casuarinus]|uniref:Kin of IRRE-like protein 3 n=1 Tax=Cichlidogyrus casuarinus TaxID=1844966 RepID=A0ABD2Q628_9PLAT
MPVQLDLDVVDAAIMALQSRADAYSVVKIKCSKLRHGTVVTCQAENRGYEKYTMRAQARIAVNYGPEVVMQLFPKKQYYEQDEVVRFKCLASGRPSEFTWSWKINDTKMEQETSSQYKLVARKELHNSDIKCEASSLTGTHEQSFRLNILYPPGFSSETPQLYSASVGDGARMLCETTGNPKPEVFWTKQGALRPERLSNQKELFIPYVRSSDFGAYLCTALSASQNFQPATKTVYLAENTPEISAETEQKSSVGRTFKVVCNAHSVPLPDQDQVKWFFNDQPIVENHRYKFNRINTGKGLQAQLVIDRVDYSDFGQYRCEVANKYGSDAKTVMFSFESKSHGRKLEHP